MVTAALAPDEEEEEEEEEEKEDGGGRWGWMVARSCEREDHEGVTLGQPLVMPEEFWGDRIQKSLT